jgi:hypothetical protein
MTLNPFEHALLLDKAGSSDYANVKIPGKMTT